MEFLKNTHIDFIGSRKYAYIITATFILIGIISLIVRGGPKYGIDFTGGTSIEIKFFQQMTAGDLRNSMGKLGLADSEIKRVGPVEEYDFIIRVKQLEEGKDIAEMIQTQIRQDFPQNNFEIRSITDVGPKIGGELRRAALMATFLALLGILIYVAWRFEFKFAVGAVFALFHDTFITLGVFVFLNLEFNLTVLAAFLTLIGYSINDTIVVYDRIRENLKILRRENLGNVINISVNQTLGRTLITGVTTLMVCIVLFFFGGEVVHNFAFAMIFGIVIGTYSSVFVASPMVYEWHAWEEKKKGAKAKPLLRTMR